MTEIPPHDPDTDTATRTVIERYCTAWLAGDLASVLDCYGDDFTIHYFGDNPFTGTHAGKDEAISVLAETSSRARRRLVAVEEILVGGDGAAVVVREEFGTPDGAVEIRRLLRYRVADERLAECWLHDERPDVVDAAWADPTR